MQANIIKTLGNKATVELVVPVDVVKKEYQKSFNKYAQGARIDGFRKGHVPKSVLMQRYSSSINRDALEEVLNVALKDLPEQAQSLGLNLNKTIHPEINDIPAFQPEAEYKITCVVTTIPQLNIAEAKEINFEPLKIEVSDDDVKLTLDNLRTQFSTLEAAPEGATVGEKDCEVTIDFEGFRDGVAIEHGSAKDFKIEMGRTAMIPGFCEQLVGHKVGDQFEIECTFPEDYTAEELRGVKATFKITIKALSLRKLPEIDAEFIKKFGYEDDKTFEQFMAELKKQLLVQADMQSARYNLNSIFDKIMAHYGYDLFQPSKIELDAHIEQHIKENILRGQKTSAKDMQLFEALKPMLIPEALSMFLNSMLMEDLKELGALNIDTITDDELNAYIEQRSVMFDEPELYKEAIRDDQAEMNTVRNMCFNHKLYQSLCNLVTVAEKTTDYKSALELMSAQDKAVAERNRDLALKWYPVEPKA